MNIKITEKPELGALVSPHRNQNTPIHNWYSYKHGYSRELVIYLINKFNLYPGSWVLDPFCGSGTTLLTCKELGLNSCGFDILPFAILLSNVKVDNYDARDVERHLNTITSKKVEENDCFVSNLPDIPLVKKAFNPEIEKRLIKLRRAIDGILDQKVKALLKLGFLSILESVSNTSKNGGFLRIVDRKINEDEVISLFEKRVRSMIRDIVDNEKLEKGLNANVSAKIGDARKLPTTRKFDAIITSPPYPNRHDYTRIYSLEMAFDFISNNDDLKKIRYETLRSHVEARGKYIAHDYVEPGIIDESISKIKNNGINNPQVIGMLKGYFEDMYLSLSEINRCLKRGGKVAMVVSNVRFAGVNILVDEILAEVGSQAGLTSKEILAVRYRGNSSQQMRDYNREPSRESIVIWQKDKS